MIPPYHFIRASAAHLPALVPLFDAYRRFYGQPSDSEGARRFLEARLQQNESVIFIALSRKQEAAGFVQLFPIFSSVAMKRFWLLNDLYVDEAHRGQGIGEQLIEKAKQLAQDTEAKGLLLQTAVTNTVAQRLYNRTGFVRDEGSYYFEWATGSI